MRRTLSNDNVTDDCCYLDSYYLNDKSFGANRFNPIELCSFSVERNTGNDCGITLALFEVKGLGCAADSKLRRRIYSHVSSSVDPCDRSDLD